jgi:hypothetical protein
MVLKHVHYTPQAQAQASSSSSASTITASTPLFASVPVPPSTASSSSSALVSAPSDVGLRAALEQAREQARAAAEQVYTVADGLEKELTMARTERDLAIGQADTLRTELEHVNKMHTLIRTYIKTHTHHKREVTIMHF